MEQQSQKEAKRKMLSWTKKNEQKQKKSERDRRSFLPAKDTLIRDLEIFTEFYLVFLVLTDFHLTLLGFTGFYWVLLGFTGFSWVLPSFTWFFTMTNCIIPSFTEFYQVLLGFIGFLSSHTWIYLVFTEFC